MFRRHRILRAVRVTPDQMITLVRANQLVAQGKPQEAGLLFASVADAMQHNNHPRQAANLYTQAAHAYADADQPQAALAQAGQALFLFAQTRMHHRAATFYANITRKMAARGMQAQATELEREYGGHITSLPARPSMVQPRRGMLPTNCPKCGAPI